MFWNFKSLLRRFVQRELTQDLTPLQLIKIDLTDEKNLVSPKSVDIGLGAESAIKVIFLIFFPLEMHMCFGSLVHKEPGCML